MAVYSKRQLREVMVELWTDHLNVAIGKSLCRHLKPTDEREVVRKHALGRFRELLGASAKSPAMLVYLDGTLNQKTHPAEKPNENYARELLELHALGVDGGYTQKDVMEAARCLTGWVVRERWAPGNVEFVANRHDDGEKLVLGQRIGRGGGAADLERLLDIVVAHPSCARHVSRKLCRWFVADDPPAALVARTADSFVATRGNLTSLVRGVLRSPEFAAGSAGRLKRPFRFVVSALRALAADTHGRRPLLGELARMGQVPYRHPTPDGYPLEASPWLGTLLPRWGFALALVEGRIGHTRLDLARLDRALASGAGCAQHAPARVWLRHLLGRDPVPAELAPIQDYLDAGREPGSRARAIALMLSTPAFQLH
jgi:uncharacterized protein (DUF1800 family)